MKKLNSFLILVILFSFSACDNKIKDVTPNNLQEKTILSGKDLSNYLKSIETQENIDQNELDILAENIVNPTDVWNDRLKVLEGYYSLNDNDISKLYTLIRKKNFDILDSEEPENSEQLNQYYIFLERTLNELDAQAKLKYNKSIYRLDPMNKALLYAEYNVEEKLKEILFSNSRGTFYDYWGCIISTDCTTVFDPFQNFEYYFSPTYRRDLFDHGCIRQEDDIVCDNKIEYLTLSLVADLDNWDTPSNILLIAMLNNGFQGNISAKSTAPQAIDFIVGHTVIIELLELGSDNPWSFMRRNLKIIDDAPF